MSKKANKLTGDVGERVALEYLKRHEFTVICQNYRKKYGEIDIVCSKGKEIHFIEVKASVCKSLKDVSVLRARGYLPEERVDYHKVKQLRRIIETFLIEFPKWDKAKIVVDIAAVYLGQAEKKGRVFLLEDIVLE